MPREMRCRWSAALVLGLAACGSDTVDVPSAECDDDAIGWSPDIEGLVPLPIPGFEVECETGWGHGVPTRAASETLALPRGYKAIWTHPQGGFLLLPYGPLQGWSDQLGVEVAENSLLWVDASFEQVHWMRDDLDYRRPAVVDGELWTVGHDETNSYSLSRITASTGELLEREAWSADTPQSWRAAWPGDAGLWYVLREDRDDVREVVGLYRMTSFGSGVQVREWEIPLVNGTYAVSGLNPTPGGGALWGFQGVLESIAEDGSLRWTLAEPHCWVAVDDRGGFLLTCTNDGELDDHRAGLGVQRRSQADGSLLWSRVHHRFDFAGAPAADEWLGSFAYGPAALPGGGYLLAGGHAYPASACPQQPLLMAIDDAGEIEWAHRVEACGGVVVLSPTSDDAVFVHGSSYDDGDGSNGNIEASWVQRFEL